MCERKLRKGMRHGRVECRNRATGTRAWLQLKIRARPEVSAADSVDQNPHFYLALACADQRIDEGIARRVGAKDIARQRDTVSGRVDAGDHLGIRLIAIAQNGDEHYRSWPAAP